MKIGMQIHGLKELEEMIKGVPSQVANVAVRDTFRKAAVPVRRAMKKELYKASKSARLAAMVAIKQQKRKPTVIIKPYGKNANKYNLPTNIGHLWTFGHRAWGKYDYSGAKDSTWKDRAWRSSESQVRTILTEGITANLEKHYAKWKAKSTKINIRL